MKFQIFPLLILLFISCTEKQSAFETTIPTNEYKTKTFYASNIIQRRTTPSLFSTTDTTVVGNRIIKDENGNDFYQAYTRTFYEFNFKDVYINKDNGVIESRITKDIEFVIRVDKSTGADDLENANLNQSLKFKLVNESYKSDSLFRQSVDYWSASRNSEALANGTTVIDLAESVVQSGGSEKTEYKFIFNKDLYTQYFLNEDTVASVKGFLLDASALSGSIRIDTIPYLKISYLDENDSTVNEILKATTAYIWNSYTYLGNDLINDFSIRSGDREALIFEFNRDEIVNFLDSVIPFGANISFQINPLTKLVPTVELRQVTGYENTVIDYYNDGLDYGPTFTSGFYSIEKLPSIDKLANELDESGNLVTNMLNTWVGTNKLNGKVLLERTTATRRPAIIKFPKAMANDTIYKLNIYYLNKDIK